MGRAGSAVFIGYDVACNGSNVAGICQNSCYATTAATHVRYILRSPEAILYSSECRSAINRVALKKRELRSCKVAIAQWRAPHSVSRTRQLEVWHYTGEKKAEHVVLFLNRSVKMHHQRI